MKETGSFKKRKITKKRINRKRGKETKIMERKA